MSFGHAVHHLDIETHFTECIFSMGVIKIELNHLRMDVPPRCYNWIGRMGWISLGGVRYGEPYNANDIDKAPNSFFSKIFKCSKSEKVADHV